MCKAVDDPWDKLHERALRLLRFVYLGAPEKCVAREFFLIKRSIDELVDDEIIQQAKWEIETDSPVDHYGIRGEG